MAMRKREDSPEVFPNAAGIDIGGTNLRLVLANMRGAVVAKYSASTTNVRDANAVMTLISDGVKHLLREVSAPRGALKAVAAGAPEIGRAHV